MELEILKRISELTNIYTSQALVIDDYVESIEYVKDEDKLLITLKALGDDSQKNKAMERDVLKICKIDFKIKGVKVSYAQKNDTPQSMISDKTTIIAVMSGKGGVGKSNVTAKLATALQTSGKQVGIIDADIYGYSIPKLTNSISEPYVDDGKVVPVRNEDGIEVISAQHFLPKTDNRAIIWRGVKLNSLLTHFVNDVKWSQHLDYIVIDMPPGTGDVLLNINNLFDEINAIYVTTPSEDASYVAQRAIEVGSELGFKNIGIVENMAYYQVGESKHYIFGKDGAKALSEKYQLPILASIPIEQQVDSYYQTLVDNLSVAMEG